MLTLSDPEPHLWERFQRGRLSPRDVADEPVVRRWARARALRASVRNGAGSTDGAGERRLPAAIIPRLADAEPLIDNAACALRRDGGALLLADADGVIVRSFGAELFAEPAVREGLAEGERWHEAERGTNAIGTALAERTAIAVVGGAHYEQVARGLACYAAPVRDVAGKIVAVLDISVPGNAADPRFGFTVQELAASLESLLRRPASRARRSRAEPACSVHFGPTGEYSGLLAEPTSALDARGAVLVLHDVWGLDDQILETATTLAGAGYVALAPDLYARDGERPPPLTAPRLAKLRTIFDQDGSGGADRDVFDETFTIAAVREQLQILSSLQLVTANRSLERHLPVALAALRHLRQMLPTRRRVVVLGFSAGAALALHCAAAAREPETIVVDGSAAPAEPFAATLRRILHRLRSELSPDSV
jgi:dienelactone hydrolase